MHRTLMNGAPTITFLSRSPSSSRKAQALFNGLFGVRPVVEPSNEKEDSSNTHEGSFDSRISGIFDGVEEDSINDMFHPMFGKKWDSSASICASSGTIFHFLSLTSKTANESTDEDDLGLSLLSITPGPDDLRKKSASSLGDGTISQSILMSRQLLSSHMEQHSNPKILGLKLALLHGLGKPIMNSRLMGRENDGIPLLNFIPTSNNDVIHVDCEKKIDKTPMKLREVVLPYFDNATCESGNSLLTEFSRSSLSRPITGLYQWPFSSSSGISNGVAFRPMPCGTEDMNLPPPTLVFQCQSIDEAKISIEEMGGIAAKVGFSGALQQGQLRVLGLGALSGLDIRYCESQSFSTSFAEAEEAVMAGSLEELQSINVMTEGGNVKGSSTDDDDHHTTGRKTDPMTNLGDCFVELRANLKRPSGFFKSIFKERVTRVAKPYNMPFECE